MLKKIKAIITGAVVIASLTVTAGAQQDFTFLSPDGQTVSLSSLRGKVAVLLFGGIQDPQCRDEIKALQSLADRSQGKNVQASTGSASTRPPKPATISSGLLAGLQAQSSFCATIIERPSSVLAARSSSFRRWLC